MKVTIVLSLLWYISVVASLVVANADDNSDSGKSIIMTTTNSVLCAFFSSFSINFFCESSTSSASSSILAPPSTSASPSGLPFVLPEYTNIGGTFEVLDVIPHDATAFTQGLHYVPEENIMYESTGLYGKSEVRTINMETGTVLQRHKLTSNYFGEGLCYYTDTDSGVDSLIHITWKSQTGFIYDATTLDTLRTFQFTTSNEQGWGITYQPAGHEFLVSDGSEYIHRWDAHTLQEKETEEGGAATRIRIYQKNEKASFLRRNTFYQKKMNELEWDTFTNTLLANIWYEDKIIRIDVASGMILTVYNLENLFPDRSSTNADVLNGIALTSERNVIWVTGKLWPKMYRIRLID